MCKEMRFKNCIATYLTDKTYFQGLGTIVIGIENLLGQICVLSGTISTCKPITTKFDIYRPTYKLRGKRRLILSLRTV